jgi:hypothetical protein
MLLRSGHCHPAEQVVACTVQPGHADPAANIWTSAHRGLGQWTKEEACKM